MKKSLIAILVASTILAGCGESDAEKAARIAQEQAIAEQVAQEEAAKHQAAEEEELRKVVAELKKGDPFVKDAYYGYNEKGERTLHVMRETPPQAPAATAPAAPGQPIVINQAPAAQSGVSESIWPLAAGIGAGMLLANSMNQNGGYNNYAQNHRPMDYRNYDNYDNYNRNRTTVINNYHTTTIKNVRKEVTKTPTYQARLKAAPVRQPLPKANVQYAPTPKPAQQVAQPNRIPQSSTTYQPRTQAQTQPVKPAQTASKSGFGLDLNKSSTTTSRPAAQVSKQAPQSYWNQPAKANVQRAATNNNSSMKTYRATTSRPSTNRR